MVTCLARLGGDLLAEHGVEEVGVGELLRGGVLEQGLQALAALEEAEALQVLLQALELRGAHGRTSTVGAERVVDRELADLDLRARPGGRGRDGARASSARCRAVRAHRARAVLGQDRAPDTCPVSTACSATSRAAMRRCRRAARAGRPRRSAR